MPSNVVVLTQLLVSERSDLLRYLGRFLDPASAEDTLQNLYFKIVSIPGDPPIRDARHYLYRLAHNHAVDRGRAEARQRRLRETVATLLQEPPTDTARVVLAQDELQKVMAAADTLPDPTRYIFRMNRFEGVSQREIAERLGVSSTTVEKHIQNALRALDDARNGG